MLIYKIFIYGVSYTIKLCIHLITEAKYYKRTRIANTRTLLQKLALPFNIINTSSYIINSFYTHRQAWYASFMQLSLY